MSLENQIPTFETCVKKCDRAGVVEAIEHITGIKTMPYQAMILRALLSEENRTLAVSVPRQNGKSYAIRLYAVVMALHGFKIMYSCHNGGTTYKMFEAIEKIANAPTIIGKVRKLSRIRGSETIHFTEGGTIEFSTRTNSGLRGGSYDIIIFDEAQELTEEQEEAILPTISAARMSPRQVFVGTPPSPACAGTVFRRLHDRAHNGDKTVAWLEWSDETTPTDENVLELAERTNPAFGYRIEGETIQNEFSVMSLMGFRRERLGFWEIVKSGTERAIDIDAWKECGTTAPLPKGRRAYGVKITFSDIALCGVVEDGDKVRVSLIERKNAGDGVQWVADFLNARNAPNTCVVIDGRNGVDLLIDKLEWKRKGSVIKASMAVMTDASARLVERIADRSITWNEQNEVLDLSARNAIKRKIGQGWGFGGDDPAPIEGCALALYGFEKSEKKGEQRIG